MNADQSFALKIGVKRNALSSDGAVDTVTAEGSSEVRLRAGEVLVAGDLVERRGPAKEGEPASSDRGEDFLVFIVAHLVDAS